MDKLALVFTLCLLVGAGAESWTVRPPPDASAYHAQCRAVAAALPQAIGDWIGRDVEVPQQAVNLIRPNVLITRRFTNTITGQRVSVLFVHCADSRYLTSHYPPICYPTTAGMELVTARPRDWTVGDLAVRGTEYEFRSGYFGGGDSIVVLNFILLPSGEIVRDMEPVKRRQMSVRNRYYGAAQVQLVFNTAVPAEARDAALADIVSAYRPVIDVVLRGSAAVHE